MRQMEPGKSLSSEEKEKAKYICCDVFIDRVHAPALLTDKQTYSVQDKVLRVRKHTRRKHTNPVKSEKRSVVTGDTLFCMPVFRYRRRGPSIQPATITDSRKLG